MISTTSVMGPASFSVPSTLRTGIGVESFLVLMFSRCVKSFPMKSPVAPQSRRALVALVSCVSVVCSWIGRLSERSEGVVASVYSRGNFFFSHLGRFTFGVGGFLGMTGSGASKGSFISSTSKRAYRLSFCNRGMPLICCGSKNPLRIRVPPPFSLSPPYLRLVRGFATTLPFLRRPYIVCQIVVRNLLPNVRPFRNADRCRGCLVSFGLHRCP